MHLLYFWKLIFSFCVSSPKYCIICDKWPSSRLMHNSFSNSYQILQSTLSLSLPSLIELICLCKATSTSTIFEFINHVLNFFGFTLFWIYCRKNVIIRFARRTDIMPPVPLETKYHPSAVDILLIKRLITETSKQTLLQFLQHEFVNIGKSHAERLIGENLKLIAFIYLRSLVKTKLVGSQGCLAKDYVHALCIVDNGK